MTDTAKPKQRRAKRPEQSKRMSEEQLVHGHAVKHHRSPTYHSWQSMLARCERPTHRFYERYRAKGITVCERWHVFANFLADMGPRPEGRTLDRIDNAKGYEPGNCRWATASEQQNNRDDRPRYFMGGEWLTVTQLARRAGLRPGTVMDRFRRGATLEEAIRAKR